MQAQLERWASLHPTLSRTGKMLEVPPSWIVPRVAAVLGLTGILWWGNSQVFWNQKVRALGLGTKVNSMHCLLGCASLLTPSMLAACNV